MDQVDVQGIRARADARIDGCATRTDITVLCDEVEQLRAEVEELIVDRDTGFRDRMAQHDREQMRRERDQARAVIDEVSGIAGRHATGAVARGDSDERRRWLDLMIVING